MWAGTRKIAVAAHPGDPGGARNCQLCSGTGRSSGQRCPRTCLARASGGGERCCPCCACCPGDGINCANCALRFTWGHAVHRPYIMQECKRMMSTCAEEQTVCMSVCVSCSAVFHWWCFWRFSGNLPLSTRVPCKSLILFQKAESGSVEQLLDFCGRRGIGLNWFGHTKCPIQLSTSPSRAPGCSGSAFWQPWLQAVTETSGESKRFCDFAIPDPYCT